MLQNGTHTHTLDLVKWKLELFEAQFIVEPDGLSQIGKIHSQKKTQVIMLHPQECMMHNTVRPSGPLAHKRTQTLDLHFSQRGDCKYTSAMAHMCIGVMPTRAHGAHGLVGQVGGLGLLLAQMGLRMQAQMGLCMHG